MFRGGRFYRGCRGGSQFAKIRQRQEHSTQLDGTGDSNNLSMITAKFDSESATLVRATHLFVLC